MTLNTRKIIHVDMDAFYAAVEIRDNPSLKGLPVAVGGSPESRGVISTASYEARKFGVKSAMATSRALRLCPDLVLLYPDFHKYKEVSRKVMSILEEFSTIIEPLSLDEAYIDVSGSDMCGGSATLMAREIRKRIFRETGLTASAGVAPNKFLAKVASDWKKPNGQFVISPDMVDSFVVSLPVEKIPGVGRVTGGKMKAMGIRTCGDLRKYDMETLRERFGSFGRTLYFLGRGIDDREVETSYERKSLSVERTFPADIEDVSECLEKGGEIYCEFLERLRKYRSREARDIKGIFVKVKFSDFSSRSMERVFRDLRRDNFDAMFREVISPGGKPVRLMGLGVRFAPVSEPDEEGPVQLSLFP